MRKPESTIKNPTPTDARLKCELYNNINGELFNAVSFVSTMCSKKTNRKAKNLNASRLGKYFLV